MEKLKLFWKSFSNLRCNCPAWCCR